MATQKVKTKNCSPLSLLLLLDPRWKKIRIRDKHPGSAILVPIKSKYFKDSKRLACLVPFPIVGRWMERVLNPADGFLPPIRKSKRRARGFNPGPGKWCLVYAYVIILVNFTLLAIWKFRSWSIMSLAILMLYKVPVLFSKYYRNLFYRYRTLFWNGFTYVLKLLEALTDFLPSGSRSFYF